MAPNIHLPDNNVIMDEPALAAPVESSTSSSRRMANDDEPPMDTATATEEEFVDASETAEEAEQVADGEEFYFSEDEEDDVDDEFDDCCEEGTDTNTTTTTASGPCDPDRMKLTVQERDWAVAIQEAIAATPEIDTPSDFMIVQLALMHEDNVEKAVECAYTLQMTREEYKLRDTYEEGCQVLVDMIKIMPGMTLAFSYSPADHCYSTVCNLSKFTKSSLKSPENIRTWMANCMYSSHCMAPDFASMRVGAMYVAECQGYDWKKNMLDLKTSEKYWAEMGSVYPLQLHKFKCFHTPMLLNCMVSMSKRFVPKEQFSKFQVGCQYNGSLSDLYFVPNQQAAEERLLAKQGDALRRRYENEKAFSLQNAALLNPPPTAEAPAAAPAANPN